MGSPEVAQDRSGAAQDGGGFGLITPHGVIGCLCTVAIVGGFLFSDALSLSAADGLGYALGIVGLSAMALLLAYSIRKRYRFMRRAGSMRTWFEAHLVLGLLGPTAILYHCNFELGSMNSTVSLYCVLAVSGSGVGGRFLYGRMHRSLAGERDTVGSYLKKAQSESRLIESVLEHAPAAETLMKDFAKDAAGTPKALQLPLRVLTTRPRARRRKRQVLDAIQASTRPHVVSKPVEESVEESVDRYFGQLNRAVELRLFERLFSLWHAIHVPLTFILFISAGVHVVAVHLY